MTSSLGDVTIDTSDPWPALRARLEVFSKPFPHDAIELAHAHREQVAPRLVEVLETVVRDPRVADGDYMLHLFAMHLLACWRDGRAYRPLLAMGRLGRDVVEDLLGDVVTESYGRSLASVCDGDLAPLRSLIEDRSTSVWVRSAGLTAWTVRVLEGDAPEAEYEAYLTQLGLDAADRQRRGEFELESYEMLTSVVSEATDIAATGMLPLIREWYAAGMIDPQDIDIDDVETGMRESLAQRTDRMNQRRDGYVRDVAEEMAFYSGYQDAVPRQQLRWPAEPYVRPSAKVGRNEQCPCGSGRKYKKCHGAG